ncbi:hypothetical protein H4S01_004974 [Coemansia sp. RSA 2610]|nr:hypothetical protein IWW54_000874 [Coemansia sp. RSA 2705]KAJ2362049.1 hypothetical protein H4S01_004974 [Coemansia sp. RSA 2610]
MSDSDPERPRETVSWDEIVQSGQAVKATEPLTRRTCIMGRNDISFLDLPDGEKFKIYGRAVCLEVMSKQMAAVAHAQRESVQFADKWYGAWTQRWQIVDVRGLGNIDRYLKQAACAQLASNVFPSAEARAQLLDVTPGDVVLGNLGESAARGVREFVAPVGRVGGWYWQSWADGTQERMLGRWWQGVTELSVLPLLGKMAGSAAQLWNEVVWDDSDEDR